VPHRAPAHSPPILVPDVLAYVEAPNAALGLHLGVVQVGVMQAFVGAVGATVGHWVPTLGRSRLDP
jgi:hypothetical protein